MLEGKSGTERSVLEASPTVCSRMRSDPHAASKPAVCGRTWSDPRSARWVWSNLHSARQVRSNLHRTSRVRIGLHPVRRRRSNSSAATSSVEQSAFGAIGWRAISMRCAGCRRVHPCGNREHREVLEVAASERTSQGVPRGATEVASDQSIARCSKSRRPRLQQL